MSSMVQELCWLDKYLKSYCHFKLGEIFGTPYKYIVAPDCETHKYIIAPKWESNKYIIAPDWESNKYIMAPDWESYKYRVAHNYCSTFISR